MLLCRLKNSSWVDVPGQVPAPALVFNKPDSFDHQRAFINLDKTEVQQKNTDKRLLWKSNYNIRVPRDERQPGWGPINEKDGDAQA